MLKFGLSLAGHLPFYQRALAQMRAMSQLASDAESADAGTGERSTAIEFKDGVRTVHRPDGSSRTYVVGKGDSFEPGPDPFPALTSISTWFRRLVTVVAVLIPVSLLVLGVASRQTVEVVFFMTLFGVIISVMLTSSLTPKRTWVSDFLETELTRAAHRAQRHGTSPFPPDDHA